MLDHAATTSDVAVTAPAEERRIGKIWPKRDIAQLGYMVGLGFTGPQIANVLGATKHSVSMRCLTFGLNLNRRRDGAQVVPILVSKDVAAVLDEAAAMRGMTRKAFTEHLLGAIVEDGTTTFIDNILEDVDDE